MAEQFVSYAIEVRDPMPEAGDPCPFNCGLKLVPTPAAVGAPMLDGMLACPHCFIMVVDSKTAEAYRQWINGE